MLEIESSNKTNPTEKYFEELAFTIEEEKMGCKSDSAEEKMYSLMSYKLRAIQLAKAIKSKKTNITDLVEKIVARIEKLEELTYIINILFQIRSLVALQKIDPTKLTQKYKAQKHFKSIFDIIMLVKATSSSNEVEKMIGDKEYARKFMN